MTRTRATGASTGPSARAVAAAPAVAAVAAGLAALAASSCERPERGEAALTAVLDGERAAHLAADAGLLASTVADTLTVIDAGEITRQTRAEVEAFFRTYFEGASYAEWNDVHDPVIRISADGSMAWVARRVRVDRTGPRFGGFTERDRFESAWTATYRRSGDTWRMTSVTSTFPADSRPAGILEGARRAMGGGAAASRIGYTRFRAAATGPDGPYEVTVRSSAEGAVRLEFTLGFAAGIRADDAWVRLGSGEAVQAMTDTLETFVRGHDLLMNALHPESRYGSLRHVGEESFGSVPAIRLDGTDALGAPVAFYYSREDTLPLGYRVADHLRGGGPVTTSLSAWEFRGDVRLPTRARFVQGEEVFDYELLEIEATGSASADAFDPPGP